MTSGSTDGRAKCASQGHQNAGAKRRRPEGQNSLEAVLINPLGDAIFEAVYFGQMVYIFLAGNRS